MKYDGGPAFPSHAEWPEDRSGSTRFIHCNGMSLRAHIATEFMAAMLSATEQESLDGNVFVHSDEYRAARAQEACAFADALLEELAK